jgi:nitroimidazol reductase NimA-like FMN-containing flavoprotein (pyridoxamine 5'-phosphate oxidase superfamily)
MAHTKLSPAQAGFVTTQRIAHLATVTEAGEPHVVPISPVLDEDRIVFASDTETQKARNLRGDPNVAICFDEYTEAWPELKQLVVFGRALVIPSGPEFTRDRGLLYEKFQQYEREFPIEEGDSLIVEVAIERVSAFGL